MTFGCCCPADDESLRAAKQAGADFVELDFAGLHEASEEQIAHLQKTLTDLSLPCLSYTHMLPADYRITGKKADAAAAGAYVRENMLHLAPLGARHLVFGSSGARRCEEGQPATTAIEQIVSFLKTYVGPTAKELGWYVSIEPLSECNLIRSTSDGWAVAQAVNSDAVGVLADFYHVGLVGEEPLAFQKLGQRLHHVHLAAQDGRVYPQPTDPDGYAEMIRGLRQMGYQGGVSLEAGPRRKERRWEELKESLAFLRSLQ